MAHRHNTSLPVELTDMIIDFLHDDVTSLLACALVSHSWLPSSRLHLFHSYAINDSKHFELAFYTIVVTQDVSVYVHQLTIVGQRIHCFTFKIFEALLGHLPQLRRLSLQKVSFDTTSPTTSLRAPHRHKYDAGTGLRVATSASLERRIPQRPLRKGPFELEELRLLECDATMVNYTQLFQILSLFSSIQTLFLASRSMVRRAYTYSAHPVPDWAFDRVHVAVQHLHTSDIPLAILEILLSTLGPANALRTFWYDDNVLNWTRPGELTLSASDSVAAFGRIAASLPGAHQHLRTLILGPLPMLIESSYNAQRDLVGMRLASMRGLETFHLRGYRLEPHLAGVFAALPRSVREGRIVVVGVRHAYAEGRWNRFREFAEAFEGELVRPERARMVFVLDLGFARGRLDEEEFAVLRMRAMDGFQGLSSAAPGRVRIPSKN